MARPKKIQLEDGEVYLHNFSPERSLELQEILLGKNKVVAPGTVVEVTETDIKPVDFNDLPLITAGMYQDKDTKKYMTIHIKYNPYTDVCKIVKKKVAGDFRLAGENCFKMDLVELKVF